MRHAIDASVAANSAPYVLEEAPAGGDLDDYLKYLDRFQEQAQILSLQTMQRRQLQESIQRQAEREAAVDAVTMP